MILSVTNGLNFFYATGGWNLWFFSKTIDDIQGPHPMSNWENSDIFPHDRLTTFMNPPPQTNCRHAWLFHNWSTILVIFFCNHWMKVEIISSVIDKILKFFWMRDWKNSCLFTMSHWENLRLSSPRLIDEFCDFFMWQINKIKDFVAPYQQNCNFVLWLMNEIYNFFLRVCDEIQDFYVPDWWNS